MSLLVALALIAQHPRVYHFRTLDRAPGEFVPVQAPAPPSPVNDAQRDNPYEFTEWLNRTRRVNGLRPVQYDHSLTLWATRNNIAQRERGSGHHVLGPSRRQNTAVVTGDISPYIGAIWMRSDEHRPGLLDPAITRFGIAWDGVYWTWDAR